MKSRSSIGVTAFASLALLCSAVLHSFPQTEMRSNAIDLSTWSEAKAAFEKFVIEPSCATAKEFYLSIGAGRGRDKDKRDILEHIFGHFGGPGRSKIFGIEMLSGDIYAARAAIRLLDLAYMDWRFPIESIGESLGQLIRVNPAHFLRACHDERGSQYLKNRGYPIDFMPAIMDKRPSRTLYELEMRAAALLSVKDSALERVRDDCIAAIDKKIRGYKSAMSDGDGMKVRPVSVPKGRIENIVNKMKIRPSPKIMKKVLALFSDIGNQNQLDAIYAMFPDEEPGRDTSEGPYKIVLYEARCGNEYAIELLFRSLVYVAGFYSMEISGAISNLILIRPAMYIEKLAKYVQLLESANSSSHPNYVEWTCTYIRYFDYPGDCMNTILRRRISALEGLRMPQYRELIGRCIKIMQNALTRSSTTTYFSGLSTSLI
jgi:hypothetical protein